MSSRLLFLHELEHIDIHEQLSPSGSMQRLAAVLVSCCFSLRSVAAASVGFFGVAPSGSEWVKSWLGFYDEDEELARQVRSGRQTAFALRHDPSRLLWWDQKAGYWHFGHLYDVSRGSAMIAAQDRAATPDLVRSVWRVVAFGDERWQAAPELICVRAPASTLHLFGHVPAAAGRGWFYEGLGHGWLGKYELRDDDELFNGWPRWSRVTSGGLSSACDRQIWFGDWHHATVDADAHRALGWSVGWGSHCDDGASPAGQGHLRVAAILPCQPQSGRDADGRDGHRAEPVARGRWQIRAATGESVGGAPLATSAMPSSMSDGKWIDAPGISC